MTFRTLAFSVLGLRVPLDKVALCHVVCALFSVWTKDVRQFGGWACFSFQIKVKDAYSSVLVTRSTSCILH
jgi:hypothetical protein